MTIELATTVERIAAVIDDDPLAAVVHLRAHGDLVGPCEVAARVRSHRLTADEPPVMGGADAGPTPVEHALVALGSCWVMTLAFWASKLGVRVDTCRVVVNGQLDVRGFLGLPSGVRPGCTAVGLEVTLGGPETAETYGELVGIVDEHCPVRDIFTGSTPVTSSVRLV